MPHRTSQLLALVSLFALSSCADLKPVQDEIEALRLQVESMRSDVVQVQAAGEEANREAQAATEKVASAMSTINMSLAAAQASQACCDGENQKIDRVFQSTHDPDSRVPHRVTIYYGTNRDLTAANDPKLMYGTTRAPVTYGSCEVSLPPGHESGFLEGPPWWFPWAKENPFKHVVLMSVNPATGKETFFRELTKSWPAEDTQASAFIFVHGFNVSFEDAARRTAQMAFDLKFPGLPVFFSWPSRGGVASYTVDSNTIRGSETALTNFLLDFMKNTEARNIYLIAHSMGTQALTSAFMRVVREQPNLRSRIREIILVAPDIDSEIFRNDIAPVLVGTGQSRTFLTLYATSSDKALAASKTVSGAPRAGDLGRALMLMDGIETIDASEVDTSFLKHSPFDENRTVLSDMSVLIGTGQRACARFGLEKIRSPKGVHCRMRP